MPHEPGGWGQLVFRDPVLLCGVVYFLLYFDASGFLRLGLLAAFLHECGHILLVYCVLRRFPVIEVTMTGFLYADGRAAEGPFPGAALCWLLPARRSISCWPGIWALRLEQEPPSAAVPSGRQIC